MEMIDRYVYAVTKRLPESQRNDVTDELRGLIADMLEDRVQNREAVDADVESVLLELGHPRTLAQKYRGSKKYVIGPELYDSYMMVLKIGLISVVAVSSAVFVIKVILNPVEILDYFISYIVSFFTWIIPTVFGWTTLGFTIAEHFSAGELKHINLDKGWKPSDLPPVPGPKRQIKRSESIAGMIFYMLAMVFLTFSNEYFGIWIFENGEFANVVPFLNKETYGLSLMVILIVFGFGIVKECLKFMYGKWTNSLVAFTAVANLISLVLVLFMINSSQFWNPDFMNGLVQSGFVTPGSEGFNMARNIWEQTTLWIAILFLVSLVWDVFAGWIKVRKDD